MEDIEKKEEQPIEDIEGAPEAKETSPESQEEVKDIDFEKELENLAKEEQPRDELAKALHARQKTAKDLSFLDKRIKDLGGTVEEPTIVEKPDTSRFVTVDDLKLLQAEGEVSKYAKSDAEKKVILWYVKNKGLSVEDAYLIANKGRILRSQSELKRAEGATPSSASFGGQKEKKPIAPDRSPEDQAVLTRRNLSFDPKTGTWKGKYSEEYYDQEAGRWLSRPLKR